MPEAKLTCPRCRRFRHIRKKAGAVEPSLLDYLNMPEHDATCPTKETPYRRSYGIQDD